MPAKTTYIDVPEVVGVFDTFEAMQKAIYDLMIAGFSRYDISLLGDREAIKEKLGTSYWQAKDLEDDPNRYSPSGMLPDVKVAEFCLLDKHFPS